MPATVPPTPARGTRPPNRRAITLEAATALFHRFGYASVSMSDIAGATNVGASALYRHFPSKAELLAAAVRSGFVPYREVLDEGDKADLDPAARLALVLSRLSDVTLDQRALGVLWQREARNLPADEQRALRDQLRELTRRLSADILATRPDLDGAGADLLAWCSMGALVSPSFHSAALPRREFSALLLDIATTITSMPMPEFTAADTAVAPSAPTESRRDTILTVATELFAEHGFAATGIDEIGDAAGIAGPSVYSHFDSKAAILVAAIERAHALLRIDREKVLNSTAPAREKLASLVDSYLRVANQDRAVIRTLLSEQMNLPRDEREAARRLQRDYIDAWVDLYRESSDVDVLSARIRVQAVLLIVNDAVQTPHLRDRPGFEHTLAHLAKALLDIPT